MRDNQKNKVYSWENKIISPKDKKEVPFNQIKSIIDYIWANENLKYPPRVEELPKNNKNNLGDATRLCVRFTANGTYTWVILHEVSHSMTSTIEETSNLHGALFMGIYIRLLNKYLNIDIRYLTQTLDNTGIKYKIDALPVSG